MELEDKIMSTSHPKKREQNENTQGQSVAKHADITNITAMKCQEQLDVIN